jgi:sulfate-transporting ATPase
MISQIILFAILGAATGALYSLASLGLVLTYRGSGVVNFAAGAVGMCSGFVFWGLADTYHWPWPLALLVGVLAGALFSWLIHLLMRPLRQASNLTRVVVTLSILVVVEGVMGLHWAVTNTYPVNSILPTGPVHIGSTAIGRDRLILIAIALILTIAIFFAYRFTRFGLATSAVAENKEALATLGWSPDRVAGLNWALAGALSAFATIMLIPITGLSVGLSTELLLPALAAAVVGNFTSFPLTFAGALLIGIAQGEIQRFGANINGLGDAVPFAAIILVVVLRGRALPLRAFVAERLPKVTNGLTNWRKLIFWLVVGSVVLGFILPAGWVNAFTATITGAVVLMSIVAITGFAGQISLAQWAIAGCGGLVCARLIAAGWPYWAAIIVGLLSALPIGLIVGAAAIRARGMALAIATLAFAVCIVSLVLSNQSLDGGPTGVDVGSFKLFGFDLDAVNHPGRYAVFCLIVLAIVGLALANIRRGAAGRRLLAVRANERGAAALGINVFVAKLTAFCYASLIASLGGILITLRFPSAIFTTYDTFTSITLISYAVTGGVGFITGAIIGGQGQPGGVGTQILSYISSNDLQYLTIIFGFLSLFIIVRAPNGIIELQRRQNAIFRRRIFKLLPARAAAFMEPRYQVPKLLISAPEPPDAAALPATVLEAKEVTVVFGNVRAVDKVSFTLRSGEVLGVIGPNGAGKTTLIDAITGFAPAREGALELNGVDITKQSVRERARRGLARSFQSLELFEDLNVQENVLAACDDPSLVRWVTDAVKPSRPILTPAASAAVAQLGLMDDLDRSPAELSYGKRRLLAIARAIASEPRVLMLDEPAAGLDESEREEIVTVIRRLATEWGMAVLLIEHDVALVSAVSDQMIALDFGKVVASGSPTQVRESPAVIASYLGVERASVEAELGTGEHHLDATELTLGLVGEETDEEVRP